MHPKTKTQKTGKTARRHSPRRASAEYVSVAWLKQKMPRYMVPSIRDPEEYIKGYSDAVTHLHYLLNTANR